MSETTPAPMPAADARQALDHLLGRRVRATVTRPAGPSVQVITGTLIHDALYAVRDATVRYPAADVHIDDRNLVAVEEVTGPPTYRDGVRDALAAAAREALAAATWPTRAARRLANDARPTTGGGR
jgi:hypothetical protein